RVSRPRIRSLDTRDEVPVRGRGGSPKAERAVYMDPSTVVMRKINSVSDRVEGAAVDVPRLQADDHRISADLVQRGSQRIQSDPTLIIGRNHDALGFTQAKEPQCDVDCLVTFLPDDDSDLRGVAQSVVLDIPACAAEHLMASSGQAGEVGDHRASDKTNR